MVEALDSNYLILTLVTTVSMQMFCFFIAAYFRFDKITDLAGSSNFVLNALLTLFLNQTYFARQMIMTLCVAVWGVRLGMFLLYRVLARGHDARFDEVRDNPLAFGVFWVFQAMWVYIVSLALTFVNASDSDVDLEARDWIGLAMFVVGFAFEAIADQVKHRFGQDPANKGKHLRTSVWALCRRPNYFGEILLWWGIFVMATPVFDHEDNDKRGYVAVLSPLYTMFILMFFSGVPMSEVRYDQRYADDPDYWLYKRTTPVLIPFPTALYAPLPDSLKCLLCCEFPFYTMSPEDQLAEEEQEV